MLTGTPEVRADLEKLLKEGVEIHLILLTDDLSSVIASFPGIDGLYKD